MLQKDHKKVVFNLNRDSLGNSHIIKRIRISFGEHWKMMRRTMIQNGLTSTQRKKLAAFSDEKFLMREKLDRISNLSKNVSNLLIQNKIPKSKMS